MALSTDARGRWVWSILALLLLAGCAKAVNDTSHSGGGASAGTGGAAGTGGRDAAAGGGGAADAAVDGSAAGAGGGGLGGSAGSGGGAAGSAGSSADAGSCPSLHGPAMVQFDGQCIDSTEVTNADYAAFLAANVPSSGQPSYCSWNTSFVPSNGWPATGKDTYPVIYVDWCDAYAYCKWAGKRLCGDVGGGPSDFSHENSPSSQWFNACSLAGMYAYPYGATYDPTACNGVDYDAGAPLPVKQASKCEGAWTGLFDMSGNVWEWEDSCQQTSGATDQCRLRGGWYWYNGAADLRCDTANANDRSTQNDIVGFRCCAP